MMFTEAANTVMEVARGGSLEVGGAQVHLSWWLDRDVYSSQPRPAIKSVPRQPPMGYRPTAQPPSAQPPMSKMSVQEGEDMTGPVEKLHQVSLSQGWGIPRYSCSSYLDTNNQQMYQYSVMVPAVPNSSIPGEVSEDRQLAMMNCACAALLGIAKETQRKLSSENSLTSVQGPLLQSAAANTASTASTTTILSSQEVTGLDQRQRRDGNKARKGWAARKKLQAKHH